MPIHNDVSSLLGQLAKRPMSEISRTLTAPVGEDEPVRAPVSKKSFSGSGLTLELNLASGQEIDLSIRINQAGGISQLELSSDSELSEADRNKLQSFLKQLSTSMDDLFNGKASNGDVFKFANQSGIEDVELSVYQDDGNHKQGLEFDKEGRGSGRKVEAQWYEYDRAEGVEENHDFSLTKLAKRDDQTAVYGSMNYQWLLDQVDTAMGAMEDKEQGKELSSFFKSGIQALFSTANSGSALLQELGASAQQAKEFIGRSIKVLASDITQGNQQNQPVSQQKQMNALPDFKMDFSSQRKTLGSSQSGSTQNEYQLNMAISQNSDQAHNAQKDESYQTQNRRLRMDYQSSRQQAVYEYTWTRDESIRNVFESGSLASTHYRIEERIQSQLLGENGNSEALEYKDREDTDII